MSVEAKEALARRAVAPKGWRWMPGMRAWEVDEGDHAVQQYTVLEVTGFGAKFADGDGFTFWADHRDPDDRCPLPDLDDPATLGCIEFALLPEAWANEHGPGVVEVRRLVSISGRPLDEVLVFQDGNPGFRVLVYDGKATASRAEALIACLEAAPEKAVQG